MASSKSTRFVTASQLSLLFNYRLKLTLSLLSLIGFRSGVSGTRHVSMWIRQWTLPYAPWWWGGCRWEWCTGWKWRPAPAQGSESRVNPSLSLSVRSISLKCYKLTNLYYCWNTTFFGVWPDHKWFMWSRGRLRLIWPITDGLACSMFLFPQRHSCNPSPGAKPQPRSCALASLWMYELVYVCLYIVDDNNLGQFACRPTHYSTGVCIIVSV